MDGYNEKKIITHYFEINFISVYLDQLRSKVITCVMILIIYCLLTSNGNLDILSKMCEIHCLSHWVLMAVTI